MKRIQQILAAVLVLQVILTAVVFWPRAAASSEGKLFFPNLQVDDVVALNITDNQGNQLDLRKVGDSWVLSDADDYPAQASAVTPVLEKLLALDDSHLVTRTDVSHKRLQVAEDDFVRRIAFATTDGVTHTLYLGSAPQYTATHFRLEGQDETYLTEDLGSWDLGATASAWVDATYLNIPQENISEVTLENRNGTFTFVKSDTAVESGKPPVWTLAGAASDETPDPNKIGALINRITELNLIQPLGKTADPTYGMADPQAVVTLQTNDGTVTLTVGAQNPDKNYVVKASNSDYYVTVSNFSAKGMVENTREDFMKTEPTPTPAPAQ